MGQLRTLGQIQLFAEIQRGLVTTVYKGYQETLDRTVLVKVLNPDYNPDKEIVASFQNEASINARLQHPNIAAIFEHGCIEERYYYVSEFVEGMDLQQLLQRAALPADLAVYILTEVAAGLAFAHKNGIFHKDIKPGNILISHSGEVKLTDFGMAELHQPEEISSGSTVKGTAAYLAPEQVLGGQIDARADIFALGATCYEMLTALPAFPGEDLNAVLHAVVHSRPQNYLKKFPLVPDPVCQIVTKMLEKDPELRIQSCDVLLAELTGFSDRQTSRTSKDDLRTFLSSPEQYQADRQNAVVAGKHVSSVAPVVRKFTGLYALMAVVALVFLAYLLTNGREPGSDNQETADTRPKTVETQNVSTDPDLAQERQNAEQKPNARALTQAPDSVVIKHPAAQIAEIITNQPIEPVDDEIIPGKGILMINCTPWATIFINSDSVATTPLETGIELAAGQYMVELHNPGFPVYVENISIDAGERTEIEFSFWQSVATLELEITPWAEVYIDGELFDTIPPQERPIILAPGSHQLRMHHSSLGTFTETILAQPGLNLNLKYNLFELSQR